MSLARWHKPLIPELILILVLGRLRQIFVWLLSSWKSYSRMARATFWDPVSETWNKEKQKSSRDRREGVHFIGQSHRCFLGKPELTALSSRHTLGIPAYTREDTKNLCVHGTTSLMHASINNSCQNWGLGSQNKRLSESDFSPSSELVTTESSSPADSFKQHNTRIRYFPISRLVVGRSHFTSAPELRALGTSLYC